MIKKKLSAPKRYLIQFILTIIFFLTIIALININVDPEKIYPNKIKIFKNPFQLKKEIDKLIQSKGYLVYKEKYWNERKFYDILSTKHKNAECIILGSSSTAAVSKKQNPPILNKNCNSILNLSLSGGSIEDYFALSNNINPKVIQGKKILLGIQPFTLNFNRDLRWLIYSENFNEFINKINVKTTSSNNSYFNNKNIANLVKNLTSFEYLKESLKILLNVNEKNFKIKKFVDQKDLVSNNIIAFDGSRKIREPKNDKIDFSSNLINYKILNNRWYDETVFKLLINYKDYYSPKNQIIFILTPYHPYVWTLKNEPIVKAMIEVEKVIHSFAKKNKIKIIGSFNPKNVGCVEFEFYDALHSSSKCLAKLENYSINY